MATELKKIILFGATGGCVDILDTIHDINASLSEPRYECVGFLDDKSDMWGAEVLGAKVLGPFESASDYLSECYFVTGIGSPYNYWRRAEIISNLGIPRERFETIIHPTASISSSAEIGLGSVIHQNAAVTTNARVGDYVLILPNAVVSHDDIIGDYSIITAGVSISSGVKVGKSCYIGANSSIRQDITIGDFSQVGMGSVVLNDVAENSIVVGSPARFLKNVPKEY